MTEEEKKGDEVEKKKGKKAPKEAVKKDVASMKAGDYTVHLLI